MSTRPQRYLHTDAASYLTPSAPAKMHPSEIALTLSADVLRLPYTPATRLVLAEIVSLYAATGCCDASNPHFMARLTLKHDVVNEAIQRLHDEGLVVKVVDKAAGFYRTLTPVPALIKAKAATNPYPEKPTSQSEKPTRYPSRKTQVTQSEKPNTPSRESRLPLVGNPDTNTPLNLPVETSSEPPTPSGGARAQKKIGAEKSDLPHLRADDSGNAPPVARPPHDGAPFAALWESWPKKEKRPAALAAFAQLSADDQQAAASRAETWLAARPDLPHREGGRYLPQLANWLSDQRWTDAIPSPATLQPHASQHPTSYPPRPVNGHKPSGNAGQLARALFAHTQQQPDSTGPGPGC